MNPRSPRGSRAGRATRAALAAATATVVSATAHTLAAEGPPSPALVVAVAVLATPVALVLVGRRLSVIRILLAVVAAQVMFHIAFALSSAGDGGPSGTSHAHHALVRMDGVASVPGVDALTLPDGGMILAHAIAALVTTLALHRGERMLRALGRGIVAVLRRTAPPFTPPSRRAVVLAALAPRHPRRIRAGSAVSSRGPPRVAPVP